MLHVTGHFDAGDIDTFDKSAVKQKSNVYHAKRRFMSPDINMHYKETFKAVGNEKGIKNDLDEMRFRTTQQLEHNNEKVRFGGTNANPPTIFEEMAKQSRLRLNVSGKPRGLLAHEDFGRGMSSLLER